MPPIPRGRCLRRFAGLAQHHDLAALASGTDRVHAVAALVDADIYVNIQGDEPLLRPEHIDALLRPFARTDAEVTTLSTPCTPEEIDDPNAVKVVTANDGRALYFSRATIPYQRGTPLAPRKHLGIYAYRKAALRRFAELPPSPLESVRAAGTATLLEEGISIHVAHTPFDTIGVDTEEDLLAAERVLRQQQSALRVEARRSLGTMARNVEIRGIPHLAKSNRGTPVVCCGSTELVGRGLAFSLSRMGRSLPR